MYTQSQKHAAVEAYIANGCNGAKTVRELGYPTLPALLKWYTDYHPSQKSKPKRNRIRYTKDQEEEAVNCYFRNGCNMRHTIAELGYGSSSGIRHWVRKRHPEPIHPCTRTGKQISYTEETKQQAVSDLISDEMTSAEVAKKYGISRCTLYEWKLQYLGEGATRLNNADAKKKSKASYEEEIKQLKAEKARIDQELAQAKKELYQAQLRKDIYEKAAEILKKAVGSDLEKLTNREKAMVVSALRQKYPVKELLAVFHMAKSSFCYQINAIQNVHPKEQLHKRIKAIFFDNKERYGYRRIHQELKREDIRISEKIVRQIMADEHLVAKGKKRRRKYSSYMGEISPAVPNKIERDFHAAKPNEKWLTDITEFSIPAGKVYLSPIIDCFDGLPVSWTIGTSPNAQLVNTMLKKAIKTLKPNETPIVHSDRGCHYRWPGWIKLMEENGLIRSMSKKGCSPDNSACEGFFGRLKNEMFYGENWQDTSIETFINVLEEYILWYRENRIKETLGWMSPMEYRRRLGIA